MSDTICHLMHNFYKLNYDNNLRMCSDIVNLLDPIITDHSKMSYELQRLYYNSKGILNGKQYFSERAFSNIVLEITLVEKIDVLRGVTIMHSLFGNK